MTPVSPAAAQAATATAQSTAVAEAVASPLDPARCSWCGSDPLYVHYHDTDWGRPELDPRALWEKLILDGFQAGLAWITILRKRENFRQAFHGFHPEVIATWGAPEVERLLADAGIVRHRGKIEGTIASAKAYLQIEAEQGFAPFLWGFVGGAPLQNGLRAMTEAPTSSPESVAMSKALKARGFKFCGPTITYAFMQAVGMVNDHMIHCPAHAECAAMARGAGFPLGAAAINAHIGANPLP